MRCINNRRSGDRPALPRILSRAASSISLGGKTLNDERPTTSPTSTHSTASTSSTSSSNGDSANSTNSTNSTHSTHSTNSTNYTSTSNSFSRRPKMSSETTAPALPPLPPNARNHTYNSTYKLDFDRHIFGYDDNEKDPTRYDGYATSTTTTLRKGAGTDDDDNTLRRDMAEHAARVWALYNSGAPLFTREVLERLARQLDNTPGVRSGQHNVVVAIKGLDGRRVRVHTASGTFTETIHPEIVLMNVRPQIEYWTIEKLTGNALWHIRRFNPTRSFMPVRITHIQEARYRNAAGVVSQTGYNTVAELATTLAQRMVSDDAHMKPIEDPKRRRNRERSGTITRDPAAADIRVLFAHHRAAWEASEACRELRETLFASLAPQLKPRGRAIVRKIVAFACSSMGDELKPKDRERHAVQHAMLLTVRDVIKQVQADIFLQQPVDVYCQDPMYTPGDITVLAENGITVLDDPHAFLAVDETTIVVAIAPSVPVRQIVADLARPAAMIWGRLQIQEKRNLLGDSDLKSSSTSNVATTGISIDDAGGWSDPASSRVRQMLESGYAEFDFPWDPAHFGTSDGVAVYVRTGLDEAASFVEGGVTKLPPLQVTTLNKKPAVLRATDETWSTVLQAVQRTFLCQGEK